MQQTLSPQRRVGYAFLLLLLGSMLLTMLRIWREPLHGSAADGLGIEEQVERR